MLKNSDANNYFDNTSNTLNFEFCLKLKHRYFRENHFDLISKTNKTEENILRLNLDEDLILTDRIGFSINKIESFI